MALGAAMTPAEIIEQLAEETEGEGILYPNLEEALVGICRRFGQPPLAMYSYNKCIQILMRDSEGEEGLSEEDRYFMAVEHFEFNTIGAWVGDYTPTFLYCDGEE